MFSERDQPKGLRLIGIVLTVLSSVGLPHPMSAWMGASAPEEAIPALIVRAAKNQDLSFAARDRCRYEQRIVMERYNPPKKPGELSKRIAIRETVVRMEPSTKPDALGRYEVLSTIIADTDDQGRPKEKVDPKARTGIAVAVFLDELFFPLQSEKIRHLEFQEKERTVESDPLASGIRRFHFQPKADATSVILATGTVEIEEESGAVKKVEIEAMHNLHLLDKMLEKLRQVSATVRFTPYRGIFWMPTQASGSGVSEVSRYKGNFQFIFEEGKYDPVFKLPGFLQ